MTTLLLTGAAGSGKTYAAVQQVSAQIKRDPFATVWVVLPTDLHGKVFRAALLTELQHSLRSAACFGVHFFNFYDLYHHLLQITGDPQRRINAAAQSHILRAAIQQTASKLTHFNTIAEEPGFVALVANLIRELKQARITPVQYSGAANDAKDRDLALIYGRYQQLLQSRDLVDIEGEGWLALAHVAEQPTLSQPVALLVIDGFDQFNRVQAELIGLLSERAARTVITLTYQAERAETAHRRFAQTRDRLRQFVQWTEKQIDSAAANATRTTVLNGLAMNLFELAPAVTAEADAVTFVESSDPRHEVETALRMIKRQLLDGLTPDDITIVARDLMRYMPYITESATRYGLPISTSLNVPLAEIPAVAALVALIDLAAADFPRRAVIDLLRSPYLTIPGLDAAAIDALDRLSRQRIVVSGRTEWVKAVRQPLIAAGDEDSDPPKLDAVIDQEMYEKALDAFFDRITPAVSADVRTYIGWIEGLIGVDTERDPGRIAPVGRGEISDQVINSGPQGFQIAANSRASTDGAIVARDLSALAAFTHYLADLLEAYELLDEGAVIDWTVFRTDLQSVLNMEAVRSTARSGRSGQILVGSVFDVRGLPHRLVYVLGLSEGQFPAYAVDDALHLDAERVRLNESLAAFGVQLLTRSERADEASLFYELMTLAQQSLILSRPYSDGGNPWPPSAFWTAAKAVVDSPTVHIPFDQAPSIIEAASITEVMIAVMARLYAESPDELTLGAARWLSEQAAYADRWAHVVAKQSIEQRRANGLQDGYRGFVKHPTVQNAIAAALDANHVWSAAQFNEYAQCPFGFFAKRLLNLTPLAEPEPGADTRQIGSLIHAILEATYRQIGMEQLAIAADNQARALAILEAAIVAQCRAAPSRYGFRPDTLWVQRQSWLRDQLRRLVMIDFSPDSPLMKSSPVERRTYRQESVFEYVVFGEAGPLSVRGRIDRVDVAADSVLVIDYKSGAAPIVDSEMLAGRNVQILLYTAAIMQQLELSPDSVEGAFWHIPTLKLSGKLNTITDAESIQKASEGLQRRVIAARHGEFPDIPTNLDTTSGKCTKYCEFSQLCRVRAYMASNA